MHARVASVLTLFTVAVIACANDDVSLPIEAGTGLDARAAVGGAGGSAGGSTGGSSATAQGGIGGSQAGQGGTAPGTGGSATGGASGTTTPPATCTDTTPPNQTPTCADWVTWGTCSQDWFKGYCNASCKRCSTGAGGAGGASGTGGASGSGGASGGAGGAAGSGGASGGTGGAAGSGGTGGVVRPITGGAPGWASRYWDCCKPACGWKGNVPSSSTPVSSCTAQNASMGSSGYDAASACQGGPAHMCYGFGPWAVSGTLAYGFAAVSKSDYCGRCYQLQFTGTSHNSSNDPGSQSLAGKTMIVQAINNGGVGSDQFDLLIPGGGVGDFNACSSQWGVPASELGETYGGLFLACQKQNNFNYAAAKSCTVQKCTSVFGARGLTALESACKWFTDWFGAPDNPALVYKEVACPAAITSASGLSR